MVLASFGCCGGDIAADQSAVYWTESAGCAPDGGDCVGTVAKMPLDGGAIISVASEQNNPWGLAVDATHVYWANAGDACLDDAGPCSGAILSVPLAGGTITTLASQLDLPIRVAVDATNVYWTNAGRGCPFDAGVSVPINMRCGGSIMTMPLQGGTPTILASGQNNPWGIAVDRNSVYWTNFGDGTVMKVPRLGGMTTTLATGQNLPYGIVTDATSVYWAGGDGVRKVPLMGGSIATLATGLAAGIAVDPSGVYWTTSYGGTVENVSLDGGAVATLASGYAFAGIAITGTSIYSVSDFPSFVLKLPK